MKLNTFSSVGLFTLVVLVLCAFCELGFCREEDSFITMKAFGGIRKFGGTQNSAEIESIARFAVDEQNKKENGFLELARVMKASEQVVAGKIYHLTLEVIDAGNRKMYDAKVWVKPWMNFKQLQEFKHAHDAASLTSAKIGIEQGAGN